jgi:RNA polymerase sigma factor (sigma-70 family)
MTPVQAGAGGLSERNGGSAADRELTARIMAGESDALAEAYRQHVGVVFGVCRRVLRDEDLAEDVTQEVFVSLWQHPERFDASRGSLRSWLGLLAHRRSVDRVRAETSRARRDNRAEPSMPSGDDVDDALTAAWLGERVRRALALLPAEQREAVELAYYGNRSYRQVAVDLALPEGTIKSRMRIALTKLDTLLRSELAGQDTPAWT